VTSERSKKLSRSLNGKKDFTDHFYMHGLQHVEQDMKTIDHSKQELKKILEELKSPKKKGVLKRRIPIEKRQPTESGTKNTEKEENNLKEKTHRKTKTEEEEEEEEEETNRNTEKEENNLKEKTPHKKTNAEQEKEDETNLKETMKEKHRRRVACKLGYRSPTYGLSFSSRGNASKKKNANMCNILGTNSQCIFKTLLQVPSH
jgi:hypothetical protein